MIVNGYEIKPGAKLRYANLEGADLRYANLYGADLRYANLYGAKLQDADLRYANLYGADLQDTDLRYAKLRGAKLQDADLRYANLYGANLRYANLRGADLQDADLRYAKIDLIRGSEELLKKVAKHALASEDSLEMSTWHTCNTTHCIAGWAIHLHPEGRYLENKHGAEAAGLRLLGAEAYSHFFDSNEDAREYLQSILD